MRLDTDAYQVTILNNTRRITSLIPFSIPQIWPLFRLSFFSLPVQVADWRVNPPKTLGSNSMVFHGLWLNCWVCAQAEKIYVNLCLSFLHTVPSQDWDLESLEAASAREAAQALQYAVRLNDERRAQWKAWFSIVATWHQCCVVVGDCG